MALFRKPKSAGAEFPVEFDEADKKIIAQVIDRHWTMAGRERLFATLMACKHVCAAGIAGDFVECGVWRGGNAIIAADVFVREKKNATVRLFDTFAGMTAPTEHDVDNAEGKHAQEKYEKSQRDTHNEWCYASLEDVKENVRASGVPIDRVAFVKGDVLETLKEEANLPECISVLRLDTDWYESTAKELEVLWPRLSSGGILMIDDYGHWGGAKKAVDEFFGSARPFFHYIDYTGRMTVKV